MREQKTLGIVLHSIKYGETSLIVYILTRHAGRQSYLVQGVRSAKSRTNKAALFQPMFALEFEGITTPKSQLLRIKDAKTAFTPRTLIYDLSKSTITLFMAEVAYRLIRESEPNEQLFDFIYQCTQTLENMECGVANFHLWFLVNLSYFLGFYPSNEYFKGAWFDLKEGSFVAAEPEHRMTMTQSQSQTLGQLMDIRLEDLPSLKLSGEVRSSFLSVILNYFTHHFDAPLNIRSVEILREVFA